MRDVDRIKEQIAYAKLWLGILLVSDISFVGWLVSGRDATFVLINVAAWLLAPAIMGLIFVIHRRVDRLINRRVRLMPCKPSTRY